MKRTLFFLMACSALWLSAAEPVLVPQIDGEWWTVAGDPDLGKLTAPKQQPVDFAVWQAADGSWQLWSCIRGTATGGRSRLFYRWQGARLTDKDWTPMGIAMQADPAFGETPGGLQAPYVIKIGREYHLFYGDWENIAVAKGMDGKTFARQLTAEGKSGLFTEGLGANTRDIMLLKIGKQWHGYYSAFPDQQGAVYLRTTEDFKTWSEPRRVAFGGAAGTGKAAAECPFVYYHQGSGHYYLFRTQKYGLNAITRVYRSQDPTDFGVNDDKYLVAELPVAAPELVEHEGTLYMAALLPSLKGIQITKLKWVPKP